MICMKKYVFFAMTAMLLMTGCRHTKGLDALQGEWSIVSIEALNVPDSVDAFMGFDVAEKSIYGNAGCNAILGTLPDELGEMPLFAALGSTQRMCADMAVETALFDVLGRVYIFSVDGDMLYLLDADDKVTVVLKKR